MNVSATRLVAQRLRRLVQVFVAVTFATLILTRVGLEDPGRTMLGGTVTDAEVAAITDRYRLDSNYLVQYWYWLKGLIQLDLGRSEVFATDVTDLLRQRIGVTTLLVVYSIVIAMIVSVPLALYAAWKRNGIVDKTTSVVTVAALSLPGLVLGVMLSIVFVNHLGWFPRVSSKVMPWEGCGDHVRNFFLPVMTLTIPLIAVFTRLLRVDLISTLQSDFIAACRAKGLAPRQILWNHALPNSMFTLLTSIGLQLTVLLSGAVIVETLFQLSGFGQLLGEAVLRSDLLVIQSTVAIVAVAVVGVGAAVDLLYVTIDPRIRRSGTR